MTKEKSTTTKMKGMKPETLFKRAVEKKFKAWSELNPPDSKNNLCQWDAFLVGARMGHNGVFKEVSGG